MVGDEQQHAAEDQDHDAADRVADRQQVETGEAVDDRRDKRDHRRDPGQRADRGRVGQADREIDEAEQDAFGKPDQHQAVYGAVHRGDHVAGDRSPRNPMMRSLSWRSCSVSAPPSRKKKNSVSKVNNSIASR